jgi:regulator of protease activity HflC (stomatin/prohibitin superfamily)
VLRYEIKNINPPRDVLAAMEKQMRAEREKRAVMLTPEGERDAQDQQAEGDKQRVIKASEAKRQQQINEAEGEARPSSPSPRRRPRACARWPSLQMPGGHEAMQLRVAEQYMFEFGKIAKAGNTLVVPANLGIVEAEQAEAGVLDLALAALVAFLGAP